MSKINNLFFELIRVAIDTQDKLSRLPSAKEWQLLYDMAKKQSLVGVCFAGVQKLLNQRQEPPEMLYLTWMGMAAKIQQRNEVVNKQCVELQAKLAADGFKSCILKGQGVATLYRLHDNVNVNDNYLNQAERLNHLNQSINLSALRQSGDIDVWVDAPREKVVEWARAHGGKKLTGELHVDCKVFDDTAVELHFTPSIASSPIINKRLQKWFEEQKRFCFCTKDEKPSARKTKDENVNPNSLNQAKRLNHLNDANLQAPPVEFNVVYLLHHIFRHYMYEGIGLRQMLDYYFVLRTSYERRRTKDEERKTSFRNTFVNHSSFVEDDSLRLIKRFGMEKFAGAVMYVMREVFGMDEPYLICPIDETRGRRLLEVIMEGGNFGHSTKKYKITGWNNPWSRLSRYVRRNWYLLWDYPEEIGWNVLTKLR